MCDCIYRLLPSFASPKLVKINEHCKNYLKCLNIFLSFYLDTSIKELNICLILLEQSAVCSLLIVN